MKTEPKIIYQKLEEYDGKIYNSFNNEIHILKGKDSEFSDLMRGKIESSRSDKITYRLAELTHNNIFVYFYTVLMAVLIVINIFSFFIMMFFTLTLLFCRFYEEGIVTNKINGSLKEMRKIGGES